MHNICGTLAKFGRFLENENGIVRGIHQARHKRGCEYSDYQVRSI